jgi:hypothetical protein
LGRLVFDHLQHFLSCHLTWSFCPCCPKSPLRQVMVVKLGLLMTPLNIFPLSFFFIVVHHLGLQCKIIKLWSLNVLISNRSDTKLTWWFQGWGREPCLQETLMTEW